VDIDIARPVVRHDEAETLLVVEEFHFSFDHRATRTCITLTEAAATAEAIATATETIATAAEPVAAAETVTAAKPVTTAAEAIAAATAAKAVTAAAESTTATAASAAVAEVTARARARICCAQIDAVNRNNLKATGRVLKIADNRRALRQFCVTRSLYRGRVTERVAAPVFKRYEAVALRPVEPLDRTFYGRLRYLTRSATLEVRHVDAEYCHQPEIPRHMLLVRSA
jgi:hypothetical protein